ncbi:MAG: hypothetical protein Q7U04_06910 [Bacteriovorax sp.]|nr:hypothetical protein [Bacteriovorax sp.]
MKKLMLIPFLLLLSLTSFGAAKKGGATSGGGDLLGIDATRVANQVIESINKIGTNIYSTEQLEEINIIKLELKIVIVDTELPTQTNDKIQNGAAYSIRENHVSTIFLKRDLWNSIPTLLEREVLIHHELMILNELEVTGVYTYSLKFEFYRKNFWKLALDKSTICTINVFEKEQNSKMPGKLLGSSSSQISTGTTTAHGILKTFSNGKALVWRGAIGSPGSFIMEISEAPYEEFYNKDKRKKDFIINFNSLTVKEEMRVYFDPYQIEKPALNPMVIGENFITIVNCSLF